MFVYPLVRITCDECLEAEIDIPVVPPGKGAQVVSVPYEYQGWRISDERQVCPSCDAKLEQV